METKKDINNSFCDNQSQSHSQVKYKTEEISEAINRAYYDEMTFSAVLDAVEEQVEYFAFTTADKPTAEGLCLIITEILKLPPASMVRIGGNNLPAEMVQAIYYRLTHEHIELVMSNYARAAYEIKFKKTYLRTALYNSVFEFDAHYENAVAADFPEYVKNPFGRKGER